MKTLTKYFPWIVVTAFVLYAASKMIPKRETYKEFDVSAFGALPVLDGGRIKPLDSVARANMLLIGGRSDWEDAEGNTRPAIQWLLEVMAAGDPRVDPIAKYRIIRIDNEQVLAELGLDERPGSYRYSWNEIVKSATQFDNALKAAQARDEKKAAGQKVPDDQRDLFHGKILELARRLRAYQNLASRQTPTVVPQARGSEEWLSLSEIDRKLSNLYEPTVRQQAVERVDQIYREQGQDPQKLTGDDAVTRQRLIASVTARMMDGVIERHRKEFSPSGAAFAEILKAYTENKPRAFSEAIAAYRSEYLEPLHETFRDTTRFELAFNAASPFFVAALMYVFAGVFMSLSWLGWTEPLRKAAFGLVGVALALNIGGLLGRMYMMDRPLVFVTNLYSSALMIGCAAVIGCLVLERYFRNGIGLVVGTTIGAATVKIAHHLSMDGSDNLGMLQAVLDTNFWLASHVTTITLGYSATYVAGLLGIVYIVWGLFFTTLTKDKHVALGNMIYGVTCFALLLSFVGTVLGGIWADQSWGRFWGWDPKENGAVLIVIWNSLVLHARWGGVVKQRGMAVLTIVGIMVTTWSWFGTNQLGVGLHAYGFSKSLADGCRYTWLASLFVIVLGLIPLRYWRSFSPTGEPRPESAARPNAIAPDAAQARHAESTANGHQQSAGKWKKTSKRR